MRSSTRAASRPSRGAINWSRTSPGSTGWRASSCCWRRWCSPSCTSPALLILQLLAGLALLAIRVAVHVTTLPVEFDASFGKALPVLARGRYLGAGDLPAARDVLKAAAYTYVAAALATLLDVARWFRMLRF